MQKGKNRIVVTAKYFKNENTGNSFMAIYLKTEETKFSRNTKLPKTSDPKRGKMPPRL